MSDYYPLFAIIGAIVGGIICLRIFFTLWEPINKKMTGEGMMDVTRDIQISELKNASVNVYFRSGAELTDVVLQGFCSTHSEAPYDFRQLLILQGQNEKTYYARVAEIAYFEKARCG